MARIGFIGMGNMGYAILKGLLDSYSPEDLLFTDKSVNVQFSISMAIRPAPSLL